MIINYVLYRAVVDCSPAHGYSNVVRSMCRNHLWWGVAHIFPIFMVSTFPVGNGLYLKQFFRKIHREMKTIAVCDGRTAEFTVVSWQIFVFGPMEQTAN